MSPVCVGVYCVGTTSKREREREGGGGEREG